MLSRRLLSPLKIAGALIAAGYEFVRTTAFKAIFSHANTADRTYTLPDVTDTVVLLGAAQTLTNKTLTTPVISGAAPATPVANTLYTDSLVKGWVETSGAGAWTIDDDLNVSSITDNAAGDFTVNWATAFANANYAVAVTPMGDQTANIFGRVDTGTKTTTVVRCIIKNTGNTLEDPGVGVSIIAIGDM